MQILEKTNDLSGIWANTINRASINLKKNNYDTALYQYKAAYDYFFQSNDLRGRLVCLVELGRIYIIKNKLPEAQKEFNKAIKISKKIDDKPLLISLYQNLSDLTMRQKKFEAALDFYKLSVVYKDSLNSAENRKASVQKEMQYEFDKKQTADSLKVVEERKTTSLKLKHEAYQRNFLYVGRVGVLVFAGFIFNRFRITQKQKQIIEEQKRIVDDKQKEILDSIRYAKRIQQALLPNQKYISKFLKK